MNALTRIRMAALAIGTLALGLAATPVSAATFNSAGWQNELQVTFAGYTKAETLTNFPALVVLSTNIASFQYSQFLSGTNADLVFTDGTQTNMLNYEVEAWNTNGNSYVWLQVPALASNASVWAFWGCSGQTAPACTTNGSTWSSSFAGVWHMKEGSGAKVADSAGTNNGTLFNAPVWTNGLVDGALSFNGVNQYATMSNSPALRPTFPFTVSVVAKSDLTNNPTLIADCDISGYGSYSGFSVALNTNGSVTAQVGPNTGYGSSSYRTTFATSANAVSSNAWHNITVVFNNINSFPIYVDGAPQATNSSGTGGSLAYAANNQFRLSAVYDPNGPATRYYKTQMDDVQLSTVSRSSNWIWSAYQNAASNALFNTYAQSSLTGAPTVVIQPATGVVDLYATLNATLSSTGSSATAVTAYWGQTDGGTNAANWANTNGFGTVTAICPVMLTTNITGLSPTTTYWYRYYATNSAGFAWSAPQSFTTLALLIAPAINNNAGAVRGPVFTASLRGQVTAGNPVPLAYVCWGTANAGTTDTSAWQHVDSQGINAGSFADSVGGLMSNTVYYYACFATNSFGFGWSSVTNFVSSTNVIWTGAGGNASWNTPGNWNTGLVPGPSDAVLFGNTGLTNNKVISLDASQTVYSVTIATITNFTIGAASDTNGVTNAVTLVNLDRQDVVGTEGIHTIATRVILATNAVWTVNGNNYLNVVGGIAGTSSLTKQGTAELRIAAATCSGDTIVQAGNLVAGIASPVWSNVTTTIAVNGNLIVGSPTGGPAASVVAASYSTPFNATKTFTVYSNGSLNFGNAAQYVNNGPITLIGGSFTGNQVYHNNQAPVYMTGGTYGGTIWGNNGFTITSYSNATPAIVSASFQAFYHTFTVNRGSGPIDLSFTGNMSPAYTLTKNGAGVMVISGVNTHTNTAVTGGTLLINSANAQASVTVTNATLGGIGTLGGAATYSNANVTLFPGTSTNSMTTLAPGSINANSGAHIIGTLTVGSVTQTNNVTFNKFTRLSVNLGFSPTNCDCLAVNGLINLGALASNTNYLDVATTNASLKAGAYTVASFLSLTGRFTTVRATLPGRWTVSYLGTPSGTYLLNGSIVVSVAGQGTALFMQ